MIYPFNPHFHAPLERISPVTIAYHRLKTVLTIYNNEGTVPFVLPATSHALSNPLSLPALARKLTDQRGDLTVQNRSEMVDITPEEVLRKFVSAVVTVFPLELDRKNLDKLSRFEVDGPLPMAPLMDQMVEKILAAGFWVKEAFSDVSPEEKARLLKLFPRVLDDFLTNDNISDRDASVLIASAEKIRMAHLLRGFSVLSSLFSDDFLAVIRQTGSDTPLIQWDHEKYPGLKGRFLAIRQTPAGLVLIGDKGSNVYGMDAALIIDLGGDDLYLNNAGSPVFEIHKRAVSKIRYPTGLVIDFEGDDRYMNPKFAAVASGFFGLGLILDMAGNDFYDGGQLSLGASFFGMGCLMDLSGNDTYVCSEGGQGCAFFGAARLYDGKGNDLYRGAKYVQGVGGPSGLGQLHDLRGKDHYRAGWKHGSSYGTKGIYQGCSQGVGWGFRKHAAGGVGILHDFGGNDIYEAGNFSQGTGYFLGLGVLRDNAGHDAYWGSRYCQGAAAHQAAGALLDFNGNDVYSGRIAANQGAAWDLSVACLVDYAGNDCYKAGDLSLGAGAQNGMGMFFDGEGCDRYESPAKSLGFSGDLSYGDGRNAGNMGVFLDTGGGRDLFSVKERKNNTFCVQGNMEIFLDE
ncbi:MAG: hypothetical protein GY846_10585 [Deltaproteobacteria bacterium]|nr:hypothetical protein [Deltaproteobacteria bacterium]